MRNNIPLKNSSEIKNIVLVQMDTGDAILNIYKYAKSATDGGLYEHA